MTGGVGRPGRERDDHRRQGHRGRRARPGRASTSRRSPRATGARRAWRRSSSARTRRARCTSAASRRPRPRSASPASATTCPRTPRAPRCVALIEELNADPAVSGILCQLPVPDHLDGVELTGLVDPGKDVDGLTPISAGRLALGEPGLRPCTPEGVDDPHRARRASTSRAPRPSSSAARTSSASRWRSCCSAPNATVTVCHSRTRDLPAVCRRADVLVAAVGRAADGRRRLGEAGRDRHRRRASTAPTPASSATSTSTRSRRGRRRDHAGPRRRRPDDDRLPAAQHAEGRADGRGRGRLTCGACAPRTGSSSSRAVAVPVTLVARLVPRRRATGLERPRLGAARADRRHGGARPPRRRPDRRPARATRSNLPPAVFLDGADAVHAARDARRDAPEARATPRASSRAPGSGSSRSAALKAGAWFSIRDERVDQPSRQVEPPPARPAPPAALSAASRIAAA